MPPPLTRQGQATPGRCRPSAILGDLVGDSLRFDCRKEIGLSGAGCVAAASALACPAGTRFLISLISTRRGANATHGCRLAGASASGAAELAESERAHMSAAEFTSLYR